MHENNNLRNQNFITQKLNKQVEFATASPVKSSTMTNTFLTDRINPGYSIRSNSISGEVR